MTAGTSRHRVTVTAAVLGLAIAAAATACSSAEPATPAADAPDPVSSLVEHSERLADTLISATDLADADEEVRAGLESAMTALDEVSETERIRLFAPRLDVGPGAGKSSDHTVLGYLGAQLGTLAAPSLIRDAFASVADGRDVHVDEMAEGADGEPIMNSDGTPMMHAVSTYSKGLLELDADFRSVESSDGHMISFDISTAADVWGCPDSSGHYSGTVTLKTAIVYTMPGGLEVNGQFQQLVQLGGMVGDDARISSLAFAYQSTMRGGVGATTRNSYLEASGSFRAEARLDEAVDWDGLTSMDRQSQSVSGSDADTFLESTLETAEATNAIVAAEVEKLLRSGACVTVETSPGADALSEPGQELDVTITGVSTSDGKDITTGTATATLKSGDHSVSPDLEPQQLPAHVVYTAADADGEGTVAYEIVSRRGIGRSEVTYRIAQGWLLDFDWEGVRYHTVKCGDLDGDWTVTRTGTPEGNGGNMDGVLEFTIDPVALFGYFDERLTLSFGSSVIRAAYAGEAVLDRLDDGSAVLHLHTTSGTVTYDGISRSATDIRQAPPMPLVRTGHADCSG